MVTTHQTSNLYNNYDLWIGLMNYPRNIFINYLLKRAEELKGLPTKTIPLLSKPYSDKGRSSFYSPGSGLKKEEIEKNLSNGAQESDRDLRLLNSEGIKLPWWAKTHDRNKAPKSQEEKSEEAPKKEVGIQNSTTDKATKGVTTTEETAHNAE